MDTQIKEKQLLEKRIQDITERITELNAFIINSPDKILRCKKSGNASYYSYRQSDAPGQWHYIPRDKENMYKKYAQHQYAKIVIRSLNHDLTALERFLHEYSWENEYCFAENMDPALIKLCGADFISKSDYINSWLSKTWTDAPDYEEDPGQPTLSGIMVRSKSEEFIANALYRKALPFHYEKPLFFTGFGFPIFPDFTILHPQTLEEIYWEHFGAMDDSYYATKAVKKIRSYNYNGFIPGENIIFTFETRSDPLSSVDVERTIKQQFGI